MVNKVVIKLNKTDTVICTRKGDPIAEQLDLFAGDFKAQWFEGLINTAKRFKNDFWFSELRAIYQEAPGDPNWWGSSSTKLKKAGLRPTDITRKSPIGSRRGGTDRKWLVA